MMINLMRNLINKFLILFYIIFMKGGEEDMAMCYFTVIVHGKRTFKQVPAFLKAEVKELLIAAGLEELVTEQ